MCDMDLVYEHNYVSLAVECLNQVYYLVNAFRGSSCILR